MSKATTNSMIDNSACIDAKNRYAVLCKRQNELEERAIDLEMEARATPPRSYCESLAEEKNSEDSVMRFRDEEVVLQELNQVQRDLDDIKLVVQMQEKLMDAAATTALKNDAASLVETHRKLAKRADNAFKELQAVMAADTEFRIAWHEATGRLHYAPPLKEIKVNNVFAQTAPEWLGAIGEWRERLGDYLS